MTTTPLSLTAADLPALSFDMLAVAYTANDARAIDRTQSDVARNRAMWRRERVAAEVSRRGALVRRHWDGTFMVGRPSDFAA